MTAKIITLAGKKGGTGKSTLTLTLAATLTLRGHRVLVVDTDPQGSSSKGARAAPDERPFPAVVISLAGAGRTLARELQPHADIYDFILVDTEAGTAFEATQSALLVSDLALLPCKASAADIDALNLVRPLLSRVLGTNPALRVALVASLIRNNGVTNAMLSALAGQPEHLLKTQLPDIAAFQEVLTTGLPVQSQGRGARAAVAVAEAMTDEVLNLMDS